MWIALAITGMFALVWLFLYVMCKREMRSIARQLKEIQRTDTNQLVHLVSGGKTAANMINQINLLLCELKRQEGEYQKKSRRLERMMTNISHDLRTPLTSAMGYIDLVCHSEMPERERQYELEVIERRLLRMEELINSFFDFSKVISQNKTPEIHSVNLIALIEQCIVHYYDDYSGSGREIRLDTGNVQRQEIHSNDVMLMRIFDNLIGNAYKHGVGDLSIRVECAKPERIYFENQVTEKEVDIQHIFEEFYTMDIARVKGNTGLGLAIAKEFTEMLGGRIWAEQEGTLFRIVVELLC